MAVENAIVVDLAAIKNFEDIQVAVVRPQLKADSIRHGLLLNFAKRLSNLIASLLLEADGILTP